MSKGVLHVERFARRRAAARARRARSAGRAAPHEHAATLSAWAPSLSSTVTATVEPCPRPETPPRRSGVVDRRICLARRRGRQRTAARGRRAQQCRRSGNRGDNPFARGTDARHDGDSARGGPTSAISNGRSLPGRRRGRPASQPALLQIRDDDDACRDGRRALDWPRRQRRAVAGRAKTGSRPGRSLTSPERDPPTAVPRPRRRRQT